MGGTHPLPLQLSALGCSPLSQVYINAPLFVFTPWSANASQREGLVFSPLGPDGQENSRFPRTAAEQTDPFLIAAGPSAFCRPIIIGRTLSAVSAWSLGFCPTGGESSGVQPWTADCGLMLQAPIRKTRARGFGASQDQVLLETQAMVRFGNFGSDIHLSFAGIYKSSSHHSGNKTWQPKCIFLPG